jgi:serine/threonine protein kinase
MSLTNGQTFAGYTIIRMLGSGGMGEVYLAQHPRLPRRDALKLLPREWSADDEFRARFNREADLASTLWHPHIVGVHDRGDEDGQLWISMDFVDGLDAAKLLAERYPAGMPVEEVVRIVTAVASALDYAHRQDLLHRDVKPANIMMTHLDDGGEQRILLTDFGIARNVNDISGLTKTNMTVGTMAYAAPEQLLGEDVDGRADQYSLAATTYHLLTGSQLFPNSNPAVVISRHLNVPPPALADKRPELVKLDPVLAVGLAKRPEDRFKRCSEFAEVLTEQIKQTGASTPSAPTAPAIVRKDAPAFDYDPAAPPGPKPLGGRKQTRALLLVALVALLLMSSGFTTAQLIRPGPQPTSTREQWQPYVAAATTYVTTMYEVTPETADSTAQRMLDMSVGKLHAALAGGSNALTAALQDAKTKTSCTIDGAGLESLSGDEASVLVAATVKSSTAESQNPGAGPYRLRLIVQKQSDGTLKVGDVQYPDANK